MAEGDNSGNYGYGIDPVMAMLLGGGITKDQGAQANRYGDLLSMLFDPKFAGGIGGFDPLMTVPEQYQDFTPILDSFAMSQEPILADIATTVRNQFLDPSAPSIDPMSAEKRIIDALRDDLTSSNAKKIGLTASTVNQYVQDMFKEARDNADARRKFDADQREALAGNIFGKAGLPQPWETYTAETVPRSSALQAMLNSISTDASKLERLQRQASQARSSAEQATRTRAETAAKRNPTPKTSGVSAGAGMQIPTIRNESEIRGVAAKFGLDEGLLRQAWQEGNRAANVIPPNPQDMAGTRATQEMARDNAFRNYLDMAYEEGRTDRLVASREPLKGFENEDKLLINRAANQAGRAEAKPYRDEYKRLKDALAFKAGAAEFDAAGRAYGRNKVTSPLNDALMYRFMSALGK